MRGRTVRYSEWKKIFDRCEDEGKITDELLACTKKKLKEGSQKGNLYNDFSELISMEINNRTRRHKDLFNFYNGVNDRISAVICTEEFRKGLEEVFFFEKYNVLTDEEKGKLASESCEILRGYVRDLESFLKKSEWEDVNLSYEIKESFNLLKRHEQLQRN